MSRDTPKIGSANPETIEVDYHLTFLLVLFIEGHHFINSQQFYFKRPVPLIYEFFSKNLLVSKRKLQFFFITNPTLTSTPLCIGLKNFFQKNVCCRVFTPKYIFSCKRENRSEKK